MKTPQRFSAAALAFALTIAPAFASPPALPSPPRTIINMQGQPSDALQRGYRTGYSDGYQAGWKDTVDGRQSDYRGREDYRRADRAYTAAYGSLEDYRDGYRQGFEAGYNAAYNKRGFDSTIPDTLARRSTTDNGDGGAQAPASGAPRTDTTAAPAPVAQSNDDTARHDNGQRNDGAAPAASDDATAARRADGSFSIPADTTIRIELLNRLSSDVSMRGDPFEARVVEPREYAGAIVSGRVTRVERAGKVKGRSELQLDFTQIHFVNGPWADFDAQVIEVLQAGDDQGVGEVDPEGGVRGKDSTKDDVAKVGAAAGIGAIIGAIAGGGKGAAIGAAIGGSIGAGGVLTQRGRDIRLERGQHLRIRTTRATRLN